MSIRNDLEKLSLTQAWSLRETDLYDFQRQLDRIDESRVEGNFQDAEGKSADIFVQRVCISMRYQRLKILTTIRHSFTSSVGAMATYIT